MYYFLQYSKVFEKENKINSIHAPYCLNPFRRYRNGRLTLNEFIYISPTLPRSTGQIVETGILHDPLDTWHKLNVHERSTWKKSNYVQFTFCVQGDIIHFINFICKKTSWKHVFKCYNEWWSVIYLIKYWLVDQQKDTSMTSVASFWFLWC